MSDITRLSAIVHGRVQGVFFRDFTRREANALGLKGYVRNVPDGSVEVVAEGPAEMVERLLRQVNVGPSSARVDRVEVEWEEPRGEFRRFEVRY
jgi:acylphosphatase